MARKTRVPISAARKHLFDLTELVRNSPDTIVVLEQRGRTEHVAMVREARLAYLEEQVARLAGAQEPRFQLAGSLSSDVGDAELETALQDLRQAWRPAGALPPGSGGNLRPRASTSRRKPRP